MGRAALPVAVILVSVGTAFVLTGWSRDVAPGLLLAGIVCALAALLPNSPPRRR